MLILRAIRTFALVLSTHAQMWIGSMLLPAHTRLLLQAKGRGLVALHWRALAVDCERVESKNASSASHQPAAEAQKPRGFDNASAESPPASPTWATRAASLAGRSADQALAALADAELLHGELYETLLSFAATPGRYRTAQTAPPGSS
jgi:hypothetical protein